MAKITKHAIDNLPIGKEIWEDGIMYRKGKRGGVWYIAYYIGTHQKKERVGKDGEVTKRDAQKALKARQGELLQGRFDIAKTEKPVLFRDFFKDYIKHAMSHKKDWRKDESRGEKHLIPAFGGNPLNDITPWRIEKYKSKRLSEGVVRSTVNRELALLKTIFSKAVVWGKAKENPVKKVKLYRENNRRERFFTEEEAHKLIEASEGPVKYFIIIGLNTGMRRSERLGLKWTEVSFDQGIISLKNDKSGLGRKVPINSFLKETLKSIPRIDETYVFPSTKPGKPMKDLRFSFDKAVKKSEIKDACAVTPHTLRHTYASWLAMKGVDLFTIQSLMGHKTIIMTQRYSHLCPDHKRRASEQISEVFLNNTTPEQLQHENSEKIKDFPVPVSA